MLDSKPRASRKNWRKVAFLALVIAGLTGALPAWAEYKVDRGDVLSLTFDRSQQQTRRVSVDAEGRIVIPSIGRVPVSGLTLPELEAQLNELLASRGLVRNPETVAELVETQPVYISGDVSQPGQHAFRSGLTVRQLIALAGGLDLIRIRATNPLVQVVELRADRASAAAELVRNLARSARIRAELEGRDDLVVSAPDWLPVSPALLDGVVQQEREQLTARRREVAEQKSHLERLLQQTSARLTALTEQRAAEDVALQQSIQDLARSRAQFERGVTTQNRVQEEQRFIILSRGRLSEVSAAIATARREEEELRHQLSVLDERRRLELREQHQDTIVQIERLRNTVGSQSEKLVYMASLRTQLAGSGEPPAALTIYRNRYGARSRTDGSPDAELLPGDVVEVRLHLDPIRPDQASRGN